jgi:glycine hydroxymethyltransferase
MNPTLKKILENEQNRQNTTLDLIASENYTSKAVREAVGSVFMHKYSEGYPGARYYQGNKYIDELETMAINLVKKVFALPMDWGANVQPLSGSNANLAVYNALLNPGDKILSMYLPDGGHLSHGWSIKSKEELLNTTDDVQVYKGGSKKVNIVSKFYNVVQYKTDPATFLIDYQFLEELAIKEQPKLIITGGTAYPRNIDYKKVAEIAKKVGAYYMADVAHEAGLIAAKVVDSPIGLADVVTFTTHKTLRGPKGAVIMSKNDLMELINKSIIPGMQGGAHNGTIAGIVQALVEADTIEFKEYANQILLNAKAMAKRLVELNYNVITGGSDKHLILIDLTSNGIGGKFASYALDWAGIVTNMNTIPHSNSTPLNPAGLRIGTPSITTRGLKEAESERIVDLMDLVIKESANFNLQDFNQFKEQVNNSDVIKSVKSQVEEICKDFPFRG